MGVVYFSIIPTFEPSRYCKCWIVCFYNKNATREHMTEYLKAMLDLKKTVTFGSIEGKYDIVIRSGDSNRVVRELKKRYEVVKWRRTRRD